MQQKHLHQIRSCYTNFMSKKWKLIFVTILLFSLYHFIRDIFQTIGADSWFTNIFHRPHLWCHQFCDYVTYPLDLIGIVGATIVLKRNRIAKVGTVVLLTIPLWLAATLLP